MERERGRGREGEGATDVWMEREGGRDREGEGGREGEGYQQHVSDIIFLPLIVVLLILSSSLRDLRVTAQEVRGLVPDIVSKQWNTITPRRTLSHQEHHQHDVVSTP